MFQYIECDKVVHSHPPSCHTHAHNYMPLYYHSSPNIPRNTLIYTRLICSNTSSATRSCTLIHHLVTHMHTITCPYIIIVLPTYPVIHSFIRGSYVPIHRVRQGRALSSTILSHTCTQLHAHIFSQFWQQYHNALFDTLHTLLFSPSFLIHPSTLLLTPGSSLTPLTGRSEPAVLSYFSAPLLARLLIMI